MTPPTILTFLLATMFGCANDPELNEDAVSDEELAAREDAATDIDAQVDAELAAEDAYYASRGQRPLSQWERCMYRAKRKNEKGTDACGHPPALQYPF